MSSESKFFIGDTDPRGEEWWSVAWPLLYGISLSLAVIGRWVLSSVEELEERSN